MRTILDRLGSRRPAKRGRAALSVLPILAVGALVGLYIFSPLFAAPALAQDGTLKVDVNVGEAPGPWYVSPFWIAVGVVGLVLVVTLVALAASGGGGGGQTTIVKWDWRHYRCL